MAMRAPVLVHALVAVAGVFGLWKTAGPISDHTERLLRHLDSGSWETVSDRPYQESVVRKAYASDSVDWVVSFVAANGNALLLDEANRSKTLELVGQKSLEDPETLRFHESELFEAYSLFLSEAIAETAARVGQRDSDALNRLSRLLELGRPNLKDAKERAAFDRVEQLLSTAPDFRQLGQALQAYREYDISFANGPFTRFQVFTSPPYDDAPQWNAGASELPSQGRCLGKAHTYAAPAEAVPVDFELSPRLLEVSLVRPWLSEQVLDNFAAGPRNRTTRHFGDGGDLGIIPSRLWVSMPERVRFKGVTVADQRAIEDWAKQNICCRLVCEAIEVRLDRESIRIGNDKRLAALRSDSPPLLYAIASKRRAPQ